MDSSFYDYKDPIITRRRKGDSSDPFASMSESFQIINSKVVLTEIPSHLHRVRVVGNNVSWVEKQKGKPSENEYVVDYSNKVVTFHESRNGLNLLFEYMGTGLHFVPPSMVWTKEDNGVVLETLADVLKNVQLALEGTPMYGDNNLSEIANTLTARINLGLTGSSNTTHYHDGRYYTKDEINNMDFSATYVGETEPTVNLSEGLLWYQPSTNIIKIYSGGVFKDIGKSSSGDAYGTKFVSYKNTAITSVLTDRVDIGIPEFDNLTDIIFVFKQSVYIEDGNDYTIEGSQIVSSSGSWDIGTEFNFIVLKNIVLAEEITTKLANVESGLEGKYDKTGGLISGDVHIQSGSMLSVAGIDNINLRWDTGTIIEHLTGSTHHRLKMIDSSTNNSFTVETSEDSGATWNDLIHADISGQFKYRNNDVWHSGNFDPSSIASSTDLTSHTTNANNPHNVTKTQLGLGNVEDKSSATIRSEITSSNITSGLGYTPVNKSGDTMNGTLVAQNNTNYTTKQVRNVYISTSDPSGGSNGDIWIKYIN